MKQDFEMMEMGGSMGNISSRMTPWLEIKI